MNSNFSKTFVLIFLLTIITFAGVWNNPHDAKKIESDTVFSSFSIPLKRLDPVQSYNANEWNIISQIYEPPLQYHYLKRPYELEPLTLTKMPQIRYLDKEGNEVDEHAKDLMYSEYRLEFREDIMYQNHPAFVKNKDGLLKYTELSEEELKKIDSIDNFKEVGTRRLFASDYEYAIKRMAVRQNNSPVLDTIMAYIVGLEAFSEEITQVAREKNRIHQWTDLRDYSIEGVNVIDDNVLIIRIKGKYPQFSYWLSMNFFAPIPWEADLFYNQKGLIAKNITLNWFPVGTGPYYLAENNPNKQMRLLANPNYHTEYYPSLSEEERLKSEVPLELLVDSGKKLPFVKEIIYALEKESIPLWNKFLQGYYDNSGISSEAFDQTIQVSSVGSMDLSDEMIEKGIKLRGSVEPSIFYMAFNMTDPVVGGYTEEKKKLRQAISIAQNQEEYISIFINERGTAAQGPIPPGIFGHEEGEAGTNRVVYDWIEGKRVRKSMDVAKRLLAEAGYPGGISIITGKPLKLYYDVTATGPDDRALMDWQRKQFAKLGIELVIRSTDYNRFQRKVRKGKVQLFSWGWNADYPDPENFLFLLYGPNAVVKTKGSGVNSSNYQNATYDALFDEVKTMKNTPQRKEKIEKMLEILREDAPWVWGVHSISMALSHQWYKNIFPHSMSNNMFKYRRVDAKVRASKQEKWNQPRILPLVFFIVLMVISGLVLYRIYQNRQKAVIIKEEH